MPLFVILLFKSSAQFGFPQDCQGLADEGDEHVAAEVVVSVIL